MLPRNHRFTRRQFSAARKRMKSFRSGPFLFCFREHSDHPSRCAVIVRKKTEKRATARNRFRRQVYAQLRDLVVPKTPALQLMCFHQGPDFDPHSIQPALEAFLTHYQKQRS